MANNKKSNNNSGSKITLNKIAFFSIGAASVLYLVSMILALVKIQSVAIIVGALQGIATAVMITIVAIIAWRYVKGKSIAWKILYVVFLLITIIGIIIPLVL